MSSNKRDIKPSLLLSAVSKYLITFIILGAIFFITAGTLKYSYGWLYLIAMASVMIIGLLLLYTKDKELLAKRLKAKEKEKQQKVIVAVSLITIIAMYSLPGLDYRFGWSHVPIWLVKIGVILLVLGYIIDIKVMLQNTYAGRTVEVQEKQKIIDTGLYSIVRHPMYLSMMIMYLATPLVLGSYIALIASVAFSFTLMLRIQNEEKVLSEGLAGYIEYKKKVKYRLIPYIW